PSPAGCCCRSAGTTAPRCWTGRPGRSAPGGRTTCSSPWRRRPTGTCSTAREGGQLVVTTWDVATHEVWRYVFHGGPGAGPRAAAAVEDVTGQGIDLE